MNYWSNFLSIFYIHYHSGTPNVPQGHILLNWNKKVVWQLESGGKNHFEKPMWLPHLIIIPPLLLLLLIASSHTMIAIYLLCTLTPFVLTTVLWVKWLAHQFNWLGRSCNQHIGDCTWTQVVQLQFTFCLSGCYRNLSKCELI